MKEQDTKLRGVAAIPCPHCSFVHSKAAYGSWDSEAKAYRRRRICLNLECKKGFITFEGYAETRRKKA